MTILTGASNDYESQETDSGENGSSTCYKKSCKSKIDDMVDSTLQETNKIADDGISTEKQYSSRIADKETRELVAANVMPVYCYSGSSLIPIKTELHVDLRNILLENPADTLIIFYDQMNAPFKVRVNSDTSSCRVASTYSEECLKKDQPCPIAVIGIGCRMPGDVNCPEDFWEVISNGRDVITEIPKHRWSLDTYHSQDNTKPGTHVSTRAGFISNVDCFDHSFFKISPREAAMMDPQQRHLLEVSYEAFEDAGIIPDALKSRCGVYVGIGMLDYPLMMIGDRNLMNSYAHTGVAHSVAANRISYVFNLQGPSLAVDTACASSMTSAHLACQALWNGECDLAMTCGSNALLLPEITVGFSKLNVLSPEGRSCPFDESAKGYVRSEGFSAVLLKPLNTALKDRDHIYCVIRGSAIGDNGYSQSITMPSTSAQMSLMRTAYSRFAIPLSDVDYVEAHGTGTPVGDPIEAEAIGKTFGPSRETPLKIGSGKSNFGHMECASGAVSIIKTSLMLQKRTFCPSINYSKPNPSINLEELNLEIQQKLEPLPEKKRCIVGVNNYGFGGALAHMIFEESPDASISVTNDPTTKCGWKFGADIEIGMPLLVPLSAKSATSLTKTAAKWAAFESQTDASGVVGFLATKHEHYANRLAVISDSGFNFRKSVLSFADNTQCSNVIEGQAQKEKPKICMVFPGQGQQWADMGQQLYKSEPEFRKIIIKCDKIYETFSGYSLVQKYGVFAGLDNNGLHVTEDLINQVEISQPSILFFQIGLFALWKHWGIMPDVVIGHSLGEVAAAYACGALKLEDAVAVIYHRSRLQAKLIGKGGMAAYRGNYEDSQKLCDLYDDLYVACINAPGSVTLAGDENIVQEIAENNPSKAKRLRVKCAFHTPHMETMKEEFLKATIIKPNVETNVPFYSTVLGRKTDSRLNAQYWWDNIRNPVDFLAATKAILEDENINIFLECGASATLLSCITQTAKKNTQDMPLMIASNLRLKDDRATMLQALGTLYVKGCNINWVNVTNYSGQWTPIPRYAWDHKVHWEEAEQCKKRRLGLIDRTFKGQNGVISNDVFPYLVDHVVNGSQVFPGAGYIEFIVQAYFNDSDKPSLKNIDFTHVLVISDKSGVKMQSSKSGSTVELSTADGKHCNADIMQSTKGKYGNLHLQDLIQSIDTEIKSEQLYDSFRHLGLEYGPSFQVIKTIHAGDGEALAYLTNPQNGQERVHVSMLDGCFQVALAALGLRTTMYLPVRIANFNMFLPKMPVDEQLVAYAKITDHSYSRITADICLLNENGKVLMEILGFEATNMSGVKSEVDIASCLYETKWQASTACLPNPETTETFFTFERLTEKYPVEMEAIARVETHLNTIQEVGIAYAKNALQLVSTDQIHPRNAKYVQRLQQMINTQNTNINKIDEINDIVHTLQTTLPEISVELRLLQRLGSLLPETLKDPSVALSVLFAADALALYFIDSLTTRLFYKVGAEVIAKNLQEISSRKEVIRILEVGGRMGGLAKYVLQACHSLVKEGRVEYTFTDLNTTFFVHARQTLEAYSEVKYQQLDIEKDVADQGFVPGTFDMVICMDTLHSVIKLDEGLKNMRDLISEDGWLMMYEGTNTFNISEIIFGSLELCWIFDDERVDTCWLPQDKWCEVVGKNGFSNVVGLSTPNEFFHSVIIGQKNENYLSQSRQEKYRSTGWLVYNHNNNDLTEALKAALPDDQVEFRNASLLNGDPLTSMLKNKGTNDRSINVVYIWDREDLDMQTTLKLMKQVYKHNQHVCSLWILTRNSADSDVYSSLPIGFMRVACNEIKDFPIFSVNIDASSMCDPQNVVHWLRKIFLKKDSIPDKEIVISSDGILVPRVLRLNNTSQLTKSAGEMWRLEFETGIKSVDAINFYEMDNPVLRSGEVLIKVKAAGINFKDVLLTTGLLDKLNITPQFGLECSGVVEKTCDDTGGIYVGDHVIALGDACFASHVICDSRLVVKKPESISWNEAAGIPIVYSTAYHALIDRAGLKPGETVLIHSACGGVGQAAIQVAKMVGARILCTAGNEQKRNYLRDVCGVEYVSDSHSLTFADDIKKWTKGNGVDVILNSLSGEYIAKGLEVLSPSGRFCELGKRDILDNSALHMRVLLENKSFISVQLDILAKQQPTKVQKILQNVCERINSGHIQVTSVTPNPIQNYKEIFQWMMTGKHQGKMVLDIPDTFKPPHVHPSLQLFKQDSTYVITGGLGGIGQALVRWMAEKGARHIAIVSRSGCKTNLQKCTVAYLRRMGVKVYEQEFKADVSSQKDVENTLSLLLKSAPPLKGIFHLAGVIDDAAIINMTDEQLAKALRAKAYGAWNLHQFTKDMDLDYFICSSSIITVWGNPEQAGYSAANAFLDALISKRRKQGLCGLSLQLGYVKGAGFLEDKQTTAKIMLAKGLKPLYINEYLEAMEKILRQKDLPPVVALANMEWESTISFCHKNMMKFRHLLGSSDNKASIEGLEQKHVEDKVVSKLSEMLYISAEEIDLNKPMMDYGVDSLMAVDMVNWVHKEFGLNLSQLDILGGMTTGSLLEKALDGKVVISF